MGQGTDVCVRRALMSVRAQHFMHVTSLAVACGTLHVLARCERCGVIAERTLASAHKGLVDVIATERRSLRMDASTPLSSST